MKTKIQEDFIKAMKEKNNIAKTALSSLKAKITEGEKANNNKELSEVEIIKIINKAIKQREDSALIYRKANRIEQAILEESESQVLRQYMPKQLSNDELDSILLEILSKNVNLPKQAMIGKTIGEFNKQHQGKADLDRVKSRLDILSNN